MTDNAATDEALRDACLAWQGGRDSGSTPLRAAARVVTGVKHYFEAPFITDADRDAAADEVGLARARTLLSAVALSDPLNASGWAARLTLTSTWAGRGIKSAPQDPQITAALETGEIVMPLWGLSLDRGVAESFGTRFLFELEGPFPAVVAWKHSGIKPDERELIAGGRYQVTRLDRSETRTVAGLRFLETVSA